MACPQQASFNTSLREKQGETNEERKLIIKKKKIQIITAVTQPYLCGSLELQSSTSLNARDKSVGVRKETERDRERERERERERQRDGVCCVCAVSVHECV